MKRKDFKNKYVFCYDDGKKKQFLHQTGKGIEIRNNIHQNILVINEKDDLLKQISANIVADSSYKNFKKVSIESLTPKKVLDESSRSWIGRIIKRIFSKR